MTGGGNIGTEVIVIVVVLVVVLVMLFGFGYCFIRIKARKKRKAGDREKCNANELLSSTFELNSKASSFFLNFVLAVSISNNCSVNCYVVGPEHTVLESLEFDLVTIEAATNNFSEDRRIGKGGYGEVYKVKKV